MMTDRKVKYIALSYVNIGNKLFKKTPEGIYLKFLRESERYLSISEVYGGSCVSHQEDHKMKWFIL